MQTVQTVQSVWTVLLREACRQLREHTVVEAVRETEVVVNVTPDRRGAAQETPLRNGTLEKTRADQSTRTELKPPSMYRVLLLNDDYTPMEFVVMVLRRFFGKNQEEATEIMLRIHQHGMGVCGIYTFDVAQTKAASVVHLARTEQHPLQCVVEMETAV